MTESEKAPKRTRKWLKRVAIGLGLLVGLLAVAIAAALILISTDWGREKIRAEAEAQLTKALAGGGSIGAIEGSVFGDLVVRDLVINDARGEPAVFIEKAIVAADLWPLVGGAVRLSRLTITGMRLDVRGYEDGTINLATLTRPSEDDPTDGSGSNLKIENITVTDSLVVVIMPNRPTESFENFAIASSRLELLGAETTIELGPARARHREREVDLGARAVVTLAEDRAQIADAEVSLGESQLVVDSAIIDGEAVTELEGSVYAAAATVRRLVPDSQLLANATLEFQSDGANSIRITGSVGDATIKSDVDFAIATGEADLAIGINNANLAAIWRGLPPSQLALNGSAHIGGTNAGSTNTVTATVSGVLEGKRIESAKLDASMTGDRVQATLNAASPGGSANIAAEVDLGTGEEPPRIASGSVVFKLGDLRSAGEPWVDLEGDLAGRLNVSGPLDRLSVAGSISSTRFAGFGTRVQNLNATPSLTIAGSSASGRINVTADTVMNGETRVDDLRAELASRDGVRASLSVRGSGSGAAVAVDAKLERRPSSIAASLERADVKTRGLDIALGGGDIEYTFAGASQGRVQIDDLSVRSSAGNLAIDGDLTVGTPIRGKLSIKGTQIDLKTLSGLAELKEPLAGTATLDLEVDTRAGRADIELAAINIALPGQLPRGSLQFKAKLRDRVVSLTSAAGLSRSASATLSAAINAPRNPFSPVGWQRLDLRALSELDAEVSVTKMSTFTHLHPDIPSQGTLQINAKKESSQAAIDIDFKSRKLISVRLEEPTEIDTRVTLDGGRIAAKGTASVGQRASVIIDAAGTLKGDWFRPSSYDGASVDSLETANIDIRDVDLDWWATRFVPDSLPNGALAEATLRYTESDKIATISVTTHLPKGGPRAATIDARTVLTAAIEERALTVDIDGAFASEKRLTGHAEAKFGWRDLIGGKVDYANEAITARVAIDKLPLISVREIVRTTPLSQDADIRGTLTAKANFSGTINKPEGAVTASIDGAELADVSFAALRAGGSLKNGKLDVTATGEQRGGGLLALNAQTDLNGGPKTAVQAKLAATKFDLKFLREVLPGSAIGGILSADVRASGPRDAPVILGKAAVKKGSFSPGAPLHTLKDADLSAELTRNSIIVKGKARSGRGRLTIDSEIALAGSQARSLTLALTTDKVPLDAGSMLVRIDSDVSVTGKHTDDRWTLDVDIREATVELPDERQRELHPTALPEDIVFASELEEQTGSALAAVTTEFAINVKGEESIYVRGGLANAVVSVDLKIRLVDKVSMTGTVVADQGWVDLLGRRYNIRQAGISFDGPPDPNLDVELAYEFTALTLFIEVGGRASDPRIEFRSDPAQYDEAELLSFVLGASPDEPTGTNQGAAAQATGVATSLLAGQLSNIVTQVTPIDVLKIDTDDSSAQRISVGKWLTDKFLVAYRHRFSGEVDENTYELTFEYRFLTRWFLEGYVGQQQSGADVLWIRRY